MRCLPGIEEPLDARQSHSRASLDGSVVATAHDPSLPAGLAGLGSVHDSALFDDVALTLASASGAPPPELGDTDAGAGTDTGAAETPTLSTPAAARSRARPARSRRSSRGCSCSPFAAAARVNLGAVIAACRIGIVMWAVAACAADPPGTLVVVDAQPWGRAHATALEVVVWNADGVQKSRDTFPLSGEGAVSLPVRLWVRARPEGAVEPFVVQARLISAGEPVIEAIATGETGATLRTGFLCIEDGCRDVACGSAVSCASRPSSCTRCAGGACVEAELDYGGATRCPSSEPHETACFDGDDTDADGSSDCADPDCEGRTCGDGRKLCLSGSCDCPTHEATEVDCGNGVDDDCDGAEDCGDADCPEDTACDPLGRMCTAGHCVCRGTEQCGNGEDDDCDGATDCDDADCRVDRGQETDCGNELDDDCDDLVDCADPDCDRAQCGTTHACCHARCVDISRAGNCGGCDLACAPGRICMVKMRGTALGWGCSCGSDGDCHGAQYCHDASHRCSCRSGGEGCDRTQDCSREMDDWNFCYYPWSR